MSDYWMRQCVLEKTIKGGKQQQISWIPEIHSKDGKVLDLEEDGIKEKGWTVAFVGSKRRLAKEVQDRSDDHKKLPSIKSSPD